MYLQLLSFCAANSNKLKFDKSEANKDEHGPTRTFVVSHHNHFTPLLCKNKYKYIIIVRKIFVILLVLPLLVNKNFLILWYNIYKLFLLFLYFLPLPFLFHPRLKAVDWNWKVRVRGYSYILMGFRCYLNLYPVSVVNNTCDGTSS